MAFAIVAHTLTGTNAALAGAWRTSPSFGVVPPWEALHALEAGDVALGRLDVRRTLDGPEPGLEVLRQLEWRGVRVLNGAQALLAGHDKLLTAHLLDGSGVAHPATAPFSGEWSALLERLPCVVKPRFGSWGDDVYRLERVEDVFALADAAHGRSWLETGGAIVQELVPPLGYDLRVIVANGEIVGAVRRHAAPGEWRTNVACGARRVRALHAPRALALARAAVAATGLDLAGVDLLPAGRGYVVLEVNAAVDFTAEYDLDEDVFERAATALAGAAEVRPLVAGAA